MTAEPCSDAWTPEWPRPMTVDLAALLPSTSVGRLTCNPGDVSFAVSPSLGVLVIADSVRHRHRRHGALLRCGLLLPLNHSRRYNEGGLVPGLGVGGWAVGLGGGPWVEGRWRVPAHLFAR